MDQVHPEVEREVTADRSRGGLHGVCAPHDAAHHRHGLPPFPDHRDYGARGNEGNQSVVERFALVFGVVADGELPGDSHHFHGDQLESAPFEPSQDGADQPALHAVRLDQNQRPLHAA